MSEIRKRWLYKDGTPQPIRAKNGTMICSRRCQYWEDRTDETKDKVWCKLLIMHLYENFICDAWAADEIERLRKELRSAASSMDSAVKIVKMNLPPEESRLELVPYLQNRAMIARRALEGGGEDE